MSKHALLFCLLWLALSGCSHHKQPRPSFSHTLYQPAYANGFRIYADSCGSTVIESINPWQGADSVSTRLRIAAPDAACTDGPTITAPARRIVVMSSTFVAMLDALGATDRIVGVSGIDFISNPLIRARRDSIADVGYDGNIDYERLLSAEPDLVMLYGVNGASAMEGKLTELGIPYIYIGDYLEESPLGKAEWLVAVGEVIGRREEAEKLFASIPESYNTLKAKVAEDTTPRPGVMLNVPYGDAWYMPSTGSYMARLIADAGGNYLYGKDSGNTSGVIDMETAYTLASQADVWINTGTLQSVGEVRTLCPKFADVPCLQAGRVYNHTKRSTPGGGNDFYESAVVRPDLVLRDLVKIFHPDMVTDDFVYYQQLH